MNISIYFIYLLFVVFFVFLVGLSKFKTLFNPTTAFSAGFLASACICYAFYEDLDLYDFHEVTFEIIAYGLISFLIACLIAKRYYRGKPVRRYDHSLNFNLPRVFLWFYLLFELVTIIIEALVAMSLTGASDPFTASNIMQDNFINDSNMKMPTIPLNLAFIVSNLNYYFIFIFAKKVSYKEDWKRYKIIIFIIIVGTLSSFFTGSRGNVIYPIIYFFIIKGIFKSTKNIKKEHLTLKKIFSISLASLIGVYLFVLSASAIGRDISDFDPVEYIAAYAGGEIKNLDMFVGEEKPTNKYPGAYTFSGISVYFVDKLPKIRTHRAIGAFYTGNVYTAFQNYYFDFGIIGSCVLCFIMGLFTQSLYEKYQRNLDIRNKYFHFGLHIYAYTMLGVVFSFFSEKVYLLLVWGTFKGLIIIWLFDRLVRNLSRKQYIINQYE